MDGYRRRVVPPVSTSRRTPERAYTSARAGRSTAPSTAYEDFNRAGIPLAEIVQRAGPARPRRGAGLLQLSARRSSTSVISDCKMEEGSLRCDANVSLGVEASLDQVEIQEH